VIQSVVYASEAVTPNVQLVEEYINYSPLRPHAQSLAR